MWVWFWNWFGRTSITFSRLGRWKNMKSLFSVNGCGMSALTTSFVKDPARRKKDAEIARKIREKTRAMTIHTPTWESCSEGKVVAMGCCSDCF